MALPFFFLLAYVLFQTSSHPYPKTALLTSQFGIPEACKQMEVTESRIYCLSSTNIIRSYLRDGSDQKKFIIYQGLSERIRSFSFNEDKTKIIFYLKNTLQIVSLSVNDMIFYNVLTMQGMITPGSISGVIKVGKDMLLITVPKSLSASGTALGHTLYRYNITTGTFIYPTKTILLNNNINIKLSPDKKCILFWNSTGSTHVFYLDTEFMQSKLANFPFAPTFNISQSDVMFSEDGTRLVLYIRAATQFHFYQYKLVNGQNLLRRFSNTTLSVSGGFMGMTFWSCNQYFAIFTPYNILFYTLAPNLWIGPITISYQQSFTTINKIWAARQEVISASTNFINVKSFFCPPTTSFFNSTFLCSDSPYTNPCPKSNTSNTILAPDNNFPSPNPAPAEDNSQIQNKSSVLVEPIFIPPMSVIVATQVTAAVLQNPAASSINQVPASRVIFKPVLIFFSNFDDLQLYNYIDVTFSPAIASMFEQVQSFQQEKWNFIHFNTIWRDFLGIDLQPLQIYLDNFLRQSFSSVRFLQIQNKSNGYILNTIQFYFSNFMLMLILFLLGNILFKLFACCKLSIQSLFSKYRLWLVFPIFLFDGSVQYMAYLFGFQLENLWFTNNIGKIQAAVIVFWLFIFMSLTSIIYFFIKIFEKKQSWQIFQNCQPNLKGIIYMNTVLGIRNMILGFSHHFLPQEGDQVTKKIAVLTAFQIPFLIARLSLIRTNFFISKSKQWIPLSITLVRIVMMLGFILDLKVYGLDQMLDTKLGELNGILMIVFMMFWPMMILLEVVPLIWKLSQRMIHFCGNGCKMKEIGLKIMITKKSLGKFGSEELQGKYKKAKFVIQKAVNIRGKSFISKKAGHLKEPQKVMKTQNCMGNRQDSKRQGSKRQDSKKQDSKRQESKRRDQNRYETNQGEKQIVEVFRFGAMMERKSKTKFPDKKITFKQDLRENVKNYTTVVNLSKKLSAKYGR